MHERHSWLLLVGRATILEASHIKSILLRYSSFSGQELNFDKSGIHFSRQMLDSSKEAIMSILGVQSLNPADIYLGSPLIHPRSKAQAFNFILDKLRNRLALWKSKLLSHAGRLVLIKSVLSFIPIFYMSTIAYTQRLLSQLDGVLRSFWWGSHKDRPLCLRRGAFLQA